MKYVRKPAEVEAVQWFKNGDHPDDRVGEQELDVQKLADEHPELFDGQRHARDEIPPTAPTYKRLEGAVVRFYRLPHVDGGLRHRDIAPLSRPDCLHTMKNHGWIDQGTDGLVVCPGDWVVTEFGGYRVYTTAEFQQLYVLERDWARLQS